MMRSSMVKVAVAFVAGLMVALASALIYVRAHDKTDSPPVAQIRAGAELPERRLPRTCCIPKEPPNCVAESSEAGGRNRAAARCLASPVENKKAAAREGGTAGGTRGRLCRLWRISLRWIRPQLLSSATATYPATSQAGPDQSRAPSHRLLRSPASPPEPHVVELAAGTQVVIRLGETLSTDHNYTRRHLSVELSTSALSGTDSLLRRKVRRVLGRIVEADKAGRVTRRLPVERDFDRDQPTTTAGSRYRRTRSKKRKSIGCRRENRRRCCLGALIGALGGRQRAAVAGAAAGGAAGTEELCCAASRQSKGAVLPNRVGVVSSWPARVTLPNN